MSHFLEANWQAPKIISAVSTTLFSGNLALHVEDCEKTVLNNRAKLISDLNLPGEPAWLNQVHSTDCIILNSIKDDDIIDPEKKKHRTADASTTQTLNQPLVILTADCVPIMLCNTAGTEIAAIHAGWKGLLNGIIENTVQAMHSKSTDLMAWIGPSICQNCYETSEEIKNNFLMKHAECAAAFRHRHANLPYIAEIILHKIGVPSVAHSKQCTYEEKNHYYSYRRAPQTGRIATLVWFNSRS